MNPWLQGGVLAVALLAGFLAGWFGGKATGLRMPNPWVATLLLLVGSLGGPALTYHLLGRNLLSYTAALLIAGMAAGLAFWPMGQKQGEKEWM